MGASGGVNDGKCRPECPGGGSRRRFASGPLSVYPPAPENPLKTPDRIARTVPRRLSARLGLECLPGPPGTVPNPDPVPQGEIS
jgi:hypothetical protein